MPVKSSITTHGVICYTNTEETPADIATICENCLTHSPDVIQVTCQARTAEEAWPLLLEWNQQCEPPWSERELAHKLSDALKKRKCR